MRREVSESPPVAHAARVRELQARLGRMEDLAVAFSGGVDSSVLLHASQRVLGARAVTDKRSSITLMYVDTRGLEGEKRPRASQHVIGGVFQVERAP